MKKVFKSLMVVLFTLTIFITSTVPALASQKKVSDLTVYEQESQLPFDYYGEEVRLENAAEVNTAVQTTYITVYGYEYTKGSKVYGSWRNGVSGGSSISDIVLTFDRSCDTSYNISFTATVSGSYTNGGTIGAALGVTLGASKSYSLGSGCSITVPKGKHYLIKYRPIYYKYKVVETEYLEGYVPGIGWHRMVMGTKTCYVNVFSHWDFTAVVD